MKKISLLVVFSMMCSVLMAEPIILQVESKPVEVNGKSAAFNTIIQPNGTWGYIGHQGDNFDAIVKNNLNESTVIHWHGIILPNSQDGVNGITQDLPIAAHTQTEYKFPLLAAGTYWMHSHYGLQEQIGVEAPLIVLGEDDDKYQQVVVMFQDFSFRVPMNIYNALRKDAASGIQSNPHMQHMDMPGMDSSMSINNDLNDVTYDAYLTNYHAVESPQITQVKAGGVVRLRFINGASATNFWIKLGKLDGKLIAVDGQNVKPISGSQFPIAIGQRVDILLTIPKAGGSYPIIGQVEGLKNQTGLILTTDSSFNKVIIPQLANQAESAIGYQLESKLHPLLHTNLIESTATVKNIKLSLDGNMATYHWTLNNQEWPNIAPLVVTQGDLVNLTFENKSMMSHPMHLHGYEFKVVSIDGKLVDGTFRDTVLVKPHSSVTVQFVANHVGKWMLHCHVAYHMEGGMMTYLQVNPK